MDCRGTSRWHRQYIPPFTLKQHPAPLSSSLFFLFPFLSLCPQPSPERPHLFQQELSLPPHLSPCLSLCLPLSLSLSPPVSLFPSPPPSLPLSLSLFLPASSLRFL